jgi:hypothetical protein
MLELGAWGAGGWPEAGADWRRLRSGADGASGAHGAETGRGERFLFLAVARLFVELDP